MAKYGYYSDPLQATRKVEIVAELNDGRLIIRHPSFKCFGGDMILVNKKEVTEMALQEAEEAEQKAYKAWWEADKTRQLVQAVDKKEVTDIKEKN